jgi:hypothetical protein
MPNRWPISSGNWSNAAIWSGSLIPTASDDVYANNQTVNIDTNVNVLSLRNSSITGVTSGGQFKLLDNVIVTASIQAFTTTNTVSTYNSFIEISQSNSATIVGNITTNVGSGNYKYAVKTLNSASLIISGNLIAGGASSVQTPLLHWSMGTVRILGTVTAGAAVNDYGIWVNTSGSLYVTGNIIGGTSTSTIGIVSAGVNSLINITGNVTAGTSTSAHGISNSVSNTIVVTGSVIGGTLSGNGINNSSTGRIIISGSVQANAASGVISSGNGTINVIGPISASAIVPGIQSTGTSAVNVFTGPFYNKNNHNAVYAPIIQLYSGSSTSWTFDTETYGGQQTLYTQNWPSNFPVTNNVRQGVIYGNTGQYTGTVIIPSAANVLKGVPVGSTTGSAVLTPQDVFDFAIQNLTGSNTIGNRLKNIATVQTTAANIAAYNGI